MKPDPILAEIRRTREAYAEQFGGDVRAMLADLRRRQQQSGRQVVARSPAEWAALWRSHAGLEPAPAIDLSTRMVAAVFLGTRPTAGFQAIITGAHLEGEALVIDWQEIMPRAGAMLAQVITSPFHIVSLPRHEGPVRFVKGVGETPPPGSAVPGR